VREQFLAGMKQYSTEILRNHKSTSALLDDSASPTEAFSPIRISRLI
jgi:hypothetical protein